MANHDFEAGHRVYFLSVQVVTVVWTEVVIWLVVVDLPELKSYSL